MGLLAQRAILAVAGHADNFKKWSIRRTDTNALAQSIFARPEDGGQSLVKYDDPRRTLPIGCGEIAPAHERCFHRLKIVGANYVEAGAEAFTSLPASPAFRKDLELRKRETELREPHQARALNSRLSFDAREEITVKVLAFSFLVTQ